MHRDDLFLEFVRVVERAAIAAARTMGQGDRKYADQVAVDAMRKEMETVDIDGTIVIGEGERDEAPMLYIGEKVGKGGLDPRWTSRSIRSRARTSARPGRPNAIAVLAASEKGGLLHAPDIYMEKLVVGPCSQGQGRHQRARRGQPQGHRQVPRARGARPGGDRPRPRRATSGSSPISAKAGARIRLIGDGDLSAGISAAVVGHGRSRGDGHGRRARRRAHRRRDALPQRRDPGPARADQGVRARGALKRMGIPDIKRVYRTEDLAPGKSIIFAAAGVTDGSPAAGRPLLRRRDADPALVMTTVPHQVRFIDTIHAKDDPDVKIRF